MTQVVWRWRDNALLLCAVGLLIAATYPSLWRMGFAFAGAYISVRVALIVIDQNLRARR